MLALLRVAPVPLRAFDPAHTRGDGSKLVGSDEWSF
jgi:hypothetical protein